MDTKFDKFFKFIMFYMFSSLPVLQTPPPLFLLFPGWEVSHLVFHFTEHNHLPTEHVA
jgi:hypothetical protein